MKMLVVFALSFVAALRANPPIIIYRPVPSVTVVSPLTTAPAASNQTLLNQINNTLTQRQLEHQIVTTNAALRAQPPVVRSR
jgi:hypothetical protein